jgi:hypothetical protein
MSFSFLSDAYPDYKAEAPTARNGLYEDFGVAPKQHQIRKQPMNDNDLLLQENFSGGAVTNQNTKPDAFDSNSDYFKILSADWESAKPTPKEAPLSLASPATTGCMDVATHLDKCETCRVRLETIFRKLLAKPIAPPAPTAIPQSTNWLASLNSGGYLEIVLLLLLGIFIVFVLDAFVRLGRYLKK